MAGCRIERKIQVNAYRWTGSEWVVTVEKMVDRGGNLIPSERSMTSTQNMW